MILLWMHQSKGVGEINISIQQINSVTRQNFTVSEEETTNSELIKEQADRLKKIVGFFKV